MLKMYRGGFVWEVDFSHMFIVQAIQGSQAQAFLSLGTCFNSSSARGKESTTRINYANQKLLLKLWQYYNLLQFW